MKGGRKDGVKRGLRRSSVVDHSSGLSLQLCEGEKQGTEGRMLFNSRFAT